MIVRPRQQVYVPGSPKNSSSPRGIRQGHQAKMAHGTMKLKLGAEDSHEGHPIRETLEGKQRPRISGGEAPR